MEGGKKPRRILIGSPEKNLLCEAKILKVERGHMPGFKEERKGTSGGTSGEEIGKPPDSREGIGTGKGNRREQGSRGEFKVFTSGP